MRLILWSMHGYYCCAQPVRYWAGTSVFNINKENWRLKPPGTIFRFGDQLNASKWMIKITIPCKTDSFISIEVELVDFVIDLLFSLCDLRKNGLLLNYLDNILGHWAYNCSYLVKYKHGHPFLEWNFTNILFRCHELQRLYLNFLHSTTENLVQQL